uniref:Uncharacterized protein n=1 Tax=Timema shepardi TaxID=629360 RepID=A0A7R9B046_TIMSH|nr:unnamed protein product [Timema shepardi]
MYHLSVSASLVTRVTTRFKRNLKGVQVGMRLGKISLQSSFNMTSALANYATEAGAERGADLVRASVSLLYPSHGSGCVVACMCIPFDGERSRSDLVRLGESCCIIMQLRRATCSKENVRATYATSLTATGYGTILKQDPAAGSRHTSQSMTSLEQSQPVEEDISSDRDFLQELLRVSEDDPTLILHHLEASPACNSGDNYMSAVTRVRARGSRKAGTLGIVCSTCSDCSLSLWDPDVLDDVTRVQA